MSVPTIFCDCHRNMPKACPYMMIRVFRFMFVLFGVGFFWGGGVEIFFVVCNYVFIFFVPLCR